MPACAQYQPPSETLLINADRASTWTQGATSVILLRGPVTIEMDETTLSAQSAVVWLTPVPGALVDQQQAQIALVGKAALRERDVRREADRLFVSATVRGTIRITAEDRFARDESSSELYQAARSVREAQVLSPGGAGTVVTPELPAETSTPVAPEAARPGVASVARASRASEPVRFQAGYFDLTKSPKDKVVAVLSDGVTLFQHRDNGDFIELRADRVVLYTRLDDLTDVQDQGERFRRVEDAVEAAYLEGDVRITHTPAPPLRFDEAPRSEQRLEANRVYYEFGADRAILTDAVLHTIEPKRNIPVIVRANTLRQLALGEYRAEDIELSTSSFHTPSYSVAARKAYVRTYQTGDPRVGNRTVFNARDVTFNAFGLPVFWLPAAGGSVTDRGAPLRDLRFSNNDRFGFGVETEWGLFETFGHPHPDDLDITYRLDYFTDRGFATGINSVYNGGYINETTREPWNFEGDLASYLVFDHGEDTFGGLRSPVEPDDDVRGRFLWHHQHFFPEDWQIQLTAGYASDPTFLEEWFKRDFQRDVEHDLTLYLKRQRDTEALALLLDYPINDFVTTSDMVQEQFDVERLPEIGYHRVGDALAGDQLTFFSSNTVSRLRMKTSDATLEEQGYVGLSPGIPSIGQTGVNRGDNYRGDFRQEVDWPFSAGQFRFVPYVVGRYTGYADSPMDGSLHRFQAGTGVKVNTAFWAVDDTVRSELFDLNRLRHVVEPEVHLYTSAQTDDRNDVFVYDEQTDDIHDISAVQIALRQRWQTKRGGPGRWRSVDFFTLNVEGNLFFNQPEDDELPPEQFRGLFFSSLPETSVPRNGINADTTWRVSDTTVVLADAQWNADETELATAAIGIAVSRDTNTSYFLGTRYIEVLDSNITTAALYYRLSTKYALSLSQSWDFGRGENVSSNLTVTRRFDRFFLSVTAYYDNTEDFGGLNISIAPEGLATGVSSNQIETFTGPQQR
ncbi:MAG: LPS assembly protein LptD [Tepidisphaeraceae bacterium]